MASSDLDYIVEDEPSLNHVRQLVAGLVQFNAGRGEAENRCPLGAFVRRGTEIVGGVDGYTHWRWLYVSHLWVRDDLRGEGVGRQLMTTIEHHARGRGCRSSWLDTFSFQAPDFYEAIGYRRFGELTDFPPGNNRLFLWKRLNEPASSAPSADRLPTRGASSGLGTRATTRCRIGDLKKAEGADNVQRAVASESYRD
jgi:GNAT superfamily N-acetyltransferase